MAEMEPFTFIEKSGDSGDQFRLFGDVVDIYSAKSADHDLQYVVALRKAFPELIVTACPESSVPLRGFAAAGHATFTLDTKTDSFAGWRGFVPPGNRASSGLVGESVHFAKYHYKWNNEDFIFYLINGIQYILKEPHGDEKILGPSRVLDELILAVGNWNTNITDVVWVYDRYWWRSKGLWEQVQKASWDDVILDEAMKTELVKVAHKFFDSEDVYRELKVAWKRGLLFHGPPGNGKTVSIKALMHSLSNRDKPVQTLYVRDAPYPYNIQDIFEKAREQAPCMVILEDVESIVTPTTRSYFFNEMDGLESNDGLFIVASTNYLEKLDPGLTKRPSRFDRKYLFPIPNEHERTLYCEHWRDKLKSNKAIAFPKKLCPAMAHITAGFSFAFLQECFVATMLILAAEDEDSSTGVRPFDDDNDHLDDYKLWVTFKKQVEILRGQLGDQSSQQPPLVEPLRMGESWTETIAESGRYTREVPLRGAKPSHIPKPSGFGAGATRGKMRTTGMLPKLPYYAQKGEFVNPAAYELRGGGGHLLVGETGLFNFPQARRDSVAD